MPVEEGQGLGDNDVVVIVQMFSNWLPGKIAWESGIGFIVTIGVIEAVYMQNNAIVGLSRPLLGVLEESGCKFLQKTPREVFFGEIYKPPKPG